MFFSSSLLSLFALFLTCFTGRSESSPTFKILKGQTLDVAVVFEDGTIGTRPFLIRRLMDDMFICSYNSLEDTGSVAIRSKSVSAIQSIQSLGSRESDQCVGCRCFHALCRCETKSPVGSELQASPCRYGVFKSLFNKNTIRGLQLTLWSYKQESTKSYPLYSNFTESDNSVARMIANVLPSQECLDIDMNLKTKADVLDLIRECFVYSRVGTLKKLLKTFGQDFNCSTLLSLLPWFFFERYEGGFDSNAKAVAEFLLKEVKQSINAFYNEKTALEYALECFNPEGFHWIHRNGGELGLRNRIAIIPVRSDAHVTVAKVKRFYEIFNALSVTNIKYNERLCRFEIAL